MPEPVKRTIPELSQKRLGPGQARLTMITAYDYSSALLAQKADIDMILVGDSLGMVIQGHQTPLPVTLEQMIYHTSCVARAIKSAVLIADMPFLSYQVTVEAAVTNAGKLLQAGAHAVKMEGGTHISPMIKKCVQAGIPVVGHIGLTPQSVHQLGGYKVQRQEKTLLVDAQAVEQAGAWAVVVECVPARVAQQISDKISIPTIGIGAGPHCDGQVLVFHDMLGLFDQFRPKFVKQYADLGPQIVSAIRSYCQEVQQGIFPTQEHSFD